MAGDDSDSKARVSELVRMMGFHPVDWGGLQAARDIEDVPLRLMPSWKRPVLVVFGVFLFLWFLAFMSYVVELNFVQMYILSTVLICSIFFS